MQVGGYEITVERFARSSRMTIRYNKAEGTFRVSVPKRAKEADIRAFLEKNLDWIREQAGSRPQWQPVYAPGERHMLLGRWVTLGLDVPAGDAFLRHREEVLRLLIGEMVKQRAREMGVPVTRVTIRDMRTRWGSWSREGRRMSVNLRLAAYPPELIEETVVHELCHYFHPDHSERFYEEMTRWMPDWQERKERRQQMDVTPRQG